MYDLTVVCIPYLTLSAINVYMLVWVLV